MINIELCDLIKLHCSCPIISLFVYFMFSDKSRHIDMIDMKFILISASFRGGVSPVYRNLGGDRRILFNKFIKGFALLPQTSLKKVTITYFKISWALEKPKWSGLPWSTCTLVWFCIIWEKSIFEVVPKLSKIYNFLLWWNCEWKSVSKICKCRRKCKVWKVLTPICLETFVGKCHWNLAFDWRVCVKIVLSPW